MLKRLVIPGLCLASTLWLSAAAAKAQTTASTFRSVQPKVGVSKTVIEPGGLGAVLVEPISPFVVPLGLNRYLGVTASNVGSKQLSMSRIVLPPGTRGPRNMHRDSETIIMVIQGPHTTLMGAKGEKTIISKSGEFLYIPGNTWHQWVNPSKTQTAIIVEARADANDNSNVQTIPTP